jgi:serine/threonine-protein kinase ULK/ATG1
MPVPQSNANPTSVMNRSMIQMREEDEEVKPYIVVSEIGKGSFATVFKGYHQVCTVDLTSSMCTAAQLNY